MLPTNSAEEPKLDSLGGFDAEEVEAFPEDRCRGAAEADAAFSNAFFGFEEGYVLIEAAVDLREVVEIVGQNVGSIVVCGRTDGGGESGELDGDAPF